MTGFKPALILLVAANADEAALLSIGLERWDGWRVLRVADMQTALARIAGGGVDLVVASLGPDGRPGVAEWETIWSRAAWRLNCPSSWYARRARQPR